MDHKQIAAQGGSVHYWISRKEGVSDCIVFTHGVTANHTMFEKQVDHFADHYTVLLWDVPMHGFSRPYENFSYRDTAEVLHAILKKENIEKVILVGMSMGGYPSQHFAVLYPDMVKGFIALDTTPLGQQYYSRSDLWWLRHIAPMAKLFPAKTLRKSMAKSVSMTAYSYEKMMKMLIPLSKSEIIEQMRIAYEYFAKENREVDFAFPVLILVGDKDSTGKVKEYCRAWSMNTGFPLHYIEEAKHFANGDNPEQVNEEIDNFLLGLK
ncbi:MAG: alpha/beta hydrolase [Roseburia sp.]|nr:alpha/beta hydrolase [Roseburia sp.]